MWYSRGVTGIKPRLGRVKLRLLAGNVKLRFNSALARRLGVEAIVLYPFVFFARSRERTAPATLRHEMIHVRQVRQLGWWRFYLGYLREYARHRWKLRSHDAAYRAISFEREAYAGQDAVALTEAESREIGLG